MKYKIIELDERYFAGIEHHKEIVFGKDELISVSWNKMFHEVYNNIKLKMDPHQMIGLNCNAIDFEDTQMVTYYVLTEIIDVVDQLDGIITKKLPKGKYVCFEVHYGMLGTERKQVYDYCKKEGLQIHEGFDFEMYDNSIKYGDNPDAVLQLCLKLEND